MKAEEAAFNQEKALVGAFSVIVQLHRLIVYTALFYTVTQEAGLADISITGPRAAAEKLVPPPTLPAPGRVTDTWVTCLYCTHLGVSTWP